MPKKKKCAPKKNKCAPKRCSNKKSRDILNYIQKVAHDIRRKNRNLPWIDCIKQASRIYNRNKK